MLIKQRRTKPVPHPRPVDTDRHVAGRESETYRSTAEAAESGFLFECGNRLRRAAPRARAIRCDRSTTVDHAIAPVPTDHAGPAENADDGRAFGKLDRSVHHT